MVLLDDRNVGIETEAVVDPQPDTVARTTRPSYDKQMPLIVLYTTRLAAVILAESGLSFLGLGIPPPSPSWGGMLSLDGRSYMFQAPWLAIIPGIALTVVVFGINMFGDALRDMLDPRMRGGSGRYLARVKRAIGV